mgnify:FL=1|jgi:hypothetical protein|tara:strand:+ start:102 stop:392 length:291 start_codon:yes stop_codon:yes gene_type:complete
MSSVRNKMQAVNKEQLKKEEELNNGNGTIINEDADRKIDIEAIAKQADKDAAKLLKETAVKVKEEKSKVKVKSEPKAKAKPVAKKKVKAAGTKTKK